MRSDFVDTERETNPDPSGDLIDGCMRTYRFEVETDGGSTRYTI